MEVGLGPDVDAIDQVLNKIFTETYVDKDKVGIAGFSDGATYALALGLSNGDLFSFIMAFSPAYLALGPVKNPPPVFLSHGTEDKIHPLNVSARPLVDDLQNQGIALEYHEFQGGHIIPQHLLQQAFERFLKPDPARERGKHV
jgi:phospholipase/carboxylesterase